MELTLSPHSRETIALNQILFLDPNYEILMIMLQLYRYNK
jgi:hypothetical protein